MVIDERRWTRSQGIAQAFFGARQARTPAAIDSPPLPVTSPAPPSEAPSARGEVPHAMLMEAPCTS
jgi:hypothetical protein